MQVALSLEKSVNQALLDLHEVASSHKDAQVSRKFFQPFVKYIACVIDVGNLFWGEGGGETAQ